MSSFGILFIITSLIVISIKVYENFSEEKKVHEILNDMNGFQTRKMREYVMERNLDLRANNIVDEYANKIPYERSIEKKNELKCEMFKKILKPFIPLMDENELEYYNNNDIYELNKIFGKTINTSRRFEGLNKLTKFVRKNEIYT